MDEIDYRDKPATAKPRRESKFEDFGESSITKHSGKNQLDNIDMDFSKASDDDEETGMIQNAYGRPVNRKKRPSQTEVEMQDIVNARKHTGARMRNKKGQPVKENQYQRNFDPGQAQKKTSSNPFAKSIHRASQLKKSMSRRMSGTNANWQNQDFAEEEMKQLQSTNNQNALLENLVELGHLPLTSEEYLDQITKNIDTHDLMEIIQVFQHKQTRSGGSIKIASEDGLSHSSGTNDYVVVVLKINSQELSLFYGGRFLVQIWKDKKRLFQHVHEYEIKKIHLNKTELAYTLNQPLIPTSQKDLDEAASQMTVEEKPYHGHLNFIYVIQPFTQNFARIKYPFPYEPSDKDLTLQNNGSGMGLIFQRSNKQSVAGSTILFINDEYLVVAENQEIKVAKCDEFLSLSSKQKTQEKKLNGLLGPGRNIGPNGSKLLQQKNQAQKSITYFQEKEYDEFNYDKYDDSATSSYSQSKLSSSNVDSKSRRRQPRSKLRDKTNPTGPSYQGRSDSPQGSLDNKKLLDNCPILKQRYKETEHNASLYFNEHEYEKGETEEITFRYISLLSERILAIDQASHSKSTSSNNAIIVYAAHTDELILKLYELKLDKDSIVLNTSETSSTKYKAGQSVLSGSSQHASKEDGSASNENRDYINIGEVGTKAKGDQYVGLKILHTADNQVLTVLQTKDGHVDISGDLMNIQREVSDNRLTDQIQMIGLLHEIAFSQENIHIVMREERTDIQQSNEKKYIDRIYKYSIDIQNCRINYQSRKEMPTLIASILDEDVFKTHLQIYDDFKIQSSLVLLSHGQVLSIYNMINKNWVHFFNREKIQRSNKQSKLICLQQYANVENEGDFENYAASVYGSQAELTSEDVRQSCGNFSEHCYFNKKVHEIIQVEFMSMKNENFYEFIVCQQNGKIVKISIIFPQPKKSFESTENDSIFDQIQGESGDNNQSNSSFTSNESQSERLIHQPPKILAFKIMSQCGRINSSKIYSAFNMINQVNYSLFRELGVYESRILFQFVDQDKNYNSGDTKNVWSPDIFMTNEYNQFVHLVNMESNGPSQAKNFKLVEVENSRINHLFLYDSLHKCLNIYNIDIEGADNQSMSFTLDKLEQERKVTSLKNFDYSCATKYFIDQQYLYYAWRGQLIQYDLIKGVKQSIRLSQNLIPGQYQVLQNKAVYFKNKEGHLNFVDLNWHSQQPLPYEVYKNQSVLSNKIVYDTVNNQLATFTKTNILSIFPSLTDYQREAEGTIFYNRRFIAYTLEKNPLRPIKARVTDNKQESPTLQSFKLPTDYLAQISALDVEQNMIFTWSVGTGQLLSNKFEEKHNFRGFEKHLDWNGSSLIVKSKQYQEKQEQEARSKSNKNTRYAKQNSRSVSGMAFDDEIDNSQRRTGKKGKVMNIFRKIKVTEHHVLVEKEFYHDFGNKTNAKLFINSLNDLILEFTNDNINVYSIKNDGYTQFVDKIKRPMGLNNPAYFTPDFKQVIKIEFGSKDSKNRSNRDQRKSKKNAKDNKFFFRVFRSERFSERGKDVKYEKYREIENVFLPEYTDVKQNRNGLPYIHFSSNQDICYLNCYRVEQTLPLQSKQFILNNKHLINEIYMTEEAAHIREEEDLLNFGERTKYQKDLRFSWKSRVVKIHNIHLKMVYNICNEKSAPIGIEEAHTEAENRNLIKRFNHRQFDQVSFQTNNLRLMRAFSFNSWRMIELIVKGKVQVGDLLPEKINELMKVVLPDGNSLTNLIISEPNFDCFKKICDLVKKSQKLGTPITLNMNPNIVGNTPLHVCADKTYTKAAEQALEILSQSELDNHSQFVLDTFPNLIETCPIAVSMYFSKRQFICPWSMTSTKGNLKFADQDVEFGVYSYSMLSLDQKDIEENLFEKESIIKRNLRDHEQKRLPMSIKVFDLPKLHHFNNKLGRNLVQALAETEDLSIFDKQYIQALLEYQWPLIKTNIMKDLFFPYLIFLLVFSYFSIHYFELKAHNEDGSKAYSYYIEGHIIRSILFLFCLYFLHNEYVQLKNETSFLRYLTSVSNFLDVSPVLLVIVAIVISLLTEDKEIANWERYFNSVSSFLMWFKLLYFFRIFRMYGHLIETIVQVVKDMQVFLGILTIALLAFSGTFFILAQNNSGDGVFVQSYYQAFRMMFELMLGAFDTTKFGENGYTIVYICFIVAAMFLIVILLNLLIAIISDSFAKVQNQQQRKMYQMFAAMICENYHLMSESEKTKYDSQGNLLFMSEIQTGGSSSISFSAGDSSSGLHGDQNQIHQTLGPDGISFNQQAVENQKVQLDKESLASLEKMVQHHLAQFQSKLEKKIFDPDQDTMFGLDETPLKVEKGRNFAPNQILPDSLYED